MILGLIFGVALFVVLPMLIIIDRLTTSLSNAADGIIRLFIFVLALISRDIRRVFAYHGAERKYGLLFVEPSEEVRISPAALLYGIPTAVHRCSCLNLIHVAQHEHLASVCVLNDCRDQTFFVELRQ